MHGIIPSWTSSPALRSPETWENLQSKWPEEAPASSPQFILSYLSLSLSLYHYRSQTLSSLPPPPCKSEPNMSSQIRIFANSNMDFFSPPSYRRRIRSYQYLKIPWFRLTPSQNPPSLSLNSITKSFFFLFRKSKIDISKKETTNQKCLRASPNPL